MPQYNLKSIYPQKILYFKQQWQDVKKQPPTEDFSKSLKINITFSEIIWITIRHFYLNLTMEKMMMMVKMLYMCQLSYCYNSTMIWFY